MTAPAHSDTARQDGGERAARMVGLAGFAGLVGLAGLTGQSRPCSPPHSVLHPLQDKEKKKKESILDLSKYIDKTIRVKFQGGREGEAPLPSPSTRSNEVHEE